MLDERANDEQARQRQKSLQRIGLDATARPAQARIQA